MDTSALLYSRLTHHRVDFVVSVPCKLLDGVIQLAMSDNHIVYTPVTREEEGVGVLAGASLGGRHPALFMQNSGLGNCLNAICSLVNYYGLPLLLIISHRGTEGETIDAERPMGASTTDLLRAAHVPFHEISRVEELNVLDRSLPRHWEGERPLALLFPFSFWKQDFTSHGTARQS